MASSRLDPARRLGMNVWTRGVIDDQWYLETTWPGSPECVRHARHFVAASLQVNMLPDLVDEARLVASELATNAVRHACTPFTISVERSNGDLTIGVRDWSADLPVAESPGPMADRGHGLGLVDALSASWGVTVQADGGKSVWARFRTGAS